MPQDPDVPLNALLLQEQTTKYIPPWTKPYAVGIAGFSGSGKTAISQQIIAELNQPWTVLLSFDNFYKPLSPEESRQAFLSNHDFDRPESIDLDLAVSVISELKQGRKVQIPLYSFQHHARTDKHVTIYGANVIIIEGIYALYDPRLLELMDFKVFVDTDLDVCLARRLTRDIMYRGRDLQGTLVQWERFVKPNAVASVNPTMQNADLVIPKGLENTRAIELMIKHIQTQLAAKSAEHLKRLRKLGRGPPIDLARVANVSFLPHSTHTSGIHLILLRETTDRTDFIFYFDRVAMLLIEQALDKLQDNYQDKTIACCLGAAYAGLEQVNDVVAVSIIRSGDCFMNSIRKTFPAIPVGKLLIQSDSLTGEPQLHMELLPRAPAKSKYFLFDAQIISGAGAIMAIQVLLDHRIPQLNITLVCYLLTEVAIRRILHVFPEVTVVAGKVSNLSESLPKYNPEGFRDGDWVFRNRFIDSLYFGTN